MTKYWLWPITAFLFIGNACRTAQKTVYTPDQVVPKENALLWKVSGAGLKKNSYVYGTIHLIPKSEFALSPVATEALEASKRIAFEIDMKDMTNLRVQFNLMSKAFMKNGKTLRDLLSDEDYAFVRKKMDEKGFPPGMFERLKPMFLSMMVNNDEGGSIGASNAKMTSVEMELYRLARKRKMSSDGLETAAYQMSIFDKIPYEAQAKMLVDMLRSDDGGGQEYEKMIELYKNQDINAMQNLVSDDKSGMSEYEDLLLGQRNRNWIPIMGRMMREEATFFAVGAGHLGGENGVIALLRKEGYKVEAAR